MSPAENQVEYFSESSTWKITTGLFQYLLKGAEFSITVDGECLTGSEFFELEQYEVQAGPKGEEKLVISFIHKDKGIRIKSHYILYGDTGIIGRLQDIENTSDRIMRIESMSSYRLELPSGRYRLSTLSGSWGREHQFRQEVLERGTKVLENRTGRSSNGISPWFALEDLQGGNTIISQLAWSGNWKTTFELANDNSLLVESGMNDWNFFHDLKPGAAIRTPLSVFGSVYGDLEQASNHLLRFQRNFVIPKPQDQPYPLVQFNTWYNGEGYVPIDLMKNFADVASDIGCEVFVLDAGWYDHENWGATLGDWNVDPYWFPNGLEELVEYVRSKKMRFGLWIEIEVAGEESKLYKNHPDWIQKRNGKNNIHDPTPFRLPLCLAKPEVKEWALSEMCRLIEAYSLDWIKIDFNTDLGAGCNAEDHGHQKGDGLYQYYQNYYELLDCLITRYPKLVIENCASGGMRFDLGLMHRTHTTWISDEIKPGPSLHFIHGATRAFSPAVCNHWAVDVPAYGNEGVYDFVFRIPMMGQFGIGADVKHWNKEIKDYARKNIHFYKRIRHIVASGNVYRLTKQVDWQGFGDWGADAWTAMQYVLEDQSESVVFVFHSIVAKMSRTVVLCGLDPAAKYEICFENSGNRRIKHGFELMAEGLDFQMQMLSDSEVVHLKKI